MLQFVSEKSELIFVTRTIAIIHKDLVAEGLGRNVKGELDIGESQVPLIDDVGIEVKLRVIGNIPEETPQRPSITGVETRVAAVSCFGDDERGTDGRCALTGKGGLEETIRFGIVGSHTLGFYEFVDKLEGFFFTVDFTGFYESVWDGANATLQCLCRLRAALLKVLFSRYFLGGAGGGEGECEE